MGLKHWLARAMSDDSAFGPAVDGLFDFTLRFQDYIFTLPLALLVILATPAYISRAIRKKPCTDSGGLLRGKGAVVLALAGCELANVILHATNSQLHSATSISAAALSFAASLCIAIILYVEHMYSFQPSTFLSIYLALAALFDMVKARSYFIRSGYGAVGGVAVALVALKATLVGLEEVSKARLIKPEHCTRPIGLEAVSGFWNRSLFLWLNSTLVLGFKKNITINELPDPGPEFDSESLQERFRPNWEKIRKKQSRFVLAMAGIQTLCWEFVSVFIPRMCCIGFRMAQPFLVWRLIIAVGERDTSLSTISGLIGASFLVFAGIAITNVYYEHLNFRMATFVRAILISAIFRKSMKLPYEELKNSSALTLMSTDVSGVERLFPLFHDTWASCVELGIGLYILTTTVGAASFFTLIPILVMTIISSYVSKKMGLARAGWNEKIEDRIAATSNILAQLKSIKMTAFSSLTAKALQEKRLEEIKYSARERWLRAVLHMLQAMAESMTPVAVLAAGFFWTRSTTGLDIADIFKTLSVIAVVSGPLSRILVCMPFFVGSAACLGRIQKYLLLNELVDSRIIEKDNDAELDTIIREKPIGGVGAKSQCAINLESVDIALPGMDRPLIRNANMKQQRHGSMAMLYGAVGCGKTSLLKAIIGEIRQRRGRIQLGSGQVAYCDQTTWLQNAGIKDNIIGQTEWIAHRYKDVLHCCCLEEDLKQLPDGDKTVVGSRGSALSGGQKQRVALARAMYACAPLMVLDDAISALDMTTAKTILMRMLDKNSTVRMFDTSVIMTTNILEHLPLADVVYSITESGELHQEKDVRKFVREVDAEQKSRQKASSENESTQAVQPSEERPSTDSQDMPDLENGTFERRKGDFSLYTYYLKEMGWGRVAGWIFLIVLTGVGEKIPQIFLRIWLEKEPTNYTFFGGFAALSVLYVLLTVVMVLVYYLVLVPVASNGLHWNLLQSVMGSTFSFISETDSGSIISRFSQDMTFVAQLLPKSLLEVAFISVIAIVTLGIISAGATYAAAIIPLFLGALCLIQFFYLRTSRQMRLLELEANAQLFTLFSETADGMQHIRAHQWQSNFMWQCHGLLDYSQKPYYYMFCIQRWLTLVLELSTCFIAVILVSLALYFTNTTSETAIGLAMINLITFSQLINDLIAAWVELESSLGAIARTRDFIRTTPLEKQVDKHPAAKLPDYWPLKGAVKFKNVTARYRSTGARSQPVLKNLTLKVKPGQKVSVKGRTGSGKSSLVLSILNLMIYSGTIKIDGTDIKTIRKDFLRSRITTIPQDPIELAASVRVNLDPHDEPGSSHRLFDDTLEDLLARVGLLDVVKSRGGLDTPLKSMSLSPGQKQLLCLARAILVREYTRSRIVLIDEATSSTDLETDKRLQTIMAKEFATCTVISVTHRDDGVDFADIVVEMAEGEIVQITDRRKKKAKENRHAEQGEGNESGHQEDKEKQNESDLQEEESGSGLQEDKDGLDESARQEEDGSSRHQNQDGNGVNSSA